MNKVSQNDVLVACICQALVK